MLPRATILIRNKSGMYSFEMIALSGDIVLRSDTFPSEALCRGGIIILQKYAHLLTHFEKKYSPVQQYSFIVKDTHGNTIAFSDIYWSMSSRDYAITVVRRECRNAEIKLAPIMK